MRYPSLCPLFNICLFMMHVFPLSRCWAEGPCSFPLGPCMKESSKTTRTTALERTHFRTALCIRANFTMTGSRQSYPQAFQMSQSTVLKIWNGVL